MAYQKDFSKKDRKPKEFAEEVAQVDRVTRVVKGGRRFRFRSTVVIGNRKGRVGFGIGKGSDVSESIKQATAKAKKNLVTIPLTELSIDHQVTGKFKGSKVFLKPAPEGAGIIAGGGVRIVMDLLGVKNVSAKIFGSTNKLNSIQAAIIALQSLRTKEEIFKMRGIEMPIQKSEIKNQNVKDGAEEVSKEKQDEDPSTRSATQSSLGMTKKPKTVKKPSKQFEKK